MPADVDPELIVEAILLNVEDLNTADEGSGTIWLTQTFQTVLKATLREDRVVSISTEGDTSSFAVNMPPAQLLAILTQARKRLPDADGNNTNAGAGAMLIPRFADFPLNGYGS